MTDNKTHYCLSLLIGIYGLILPFEEILFFADTSGSATFSRYVGIFIIFIFIINYLHTKSLFKLTKMQIWLLLFVVFACFSFWWSISPEVSFDRIPTLISLLLFYLVVGTFSPNTRDLDLIVILIIIGGAAAALYAAYAKYFLSLTFMHTQRASIIYGSSGINPNTFAFTLLLPLSLVLANLNQAIAKWTRLCYWFGFLVIDFGLLITVSRGAMLAMIAVISLFLWRKGIKRKKLIAVGLIIVVLSVGFISDIFLQRTLNTEDTFEHARGGIWKDALSALPDYWLMGSGLDSFGKLYSIVANQNDIPLASHSIYVGTLLELGIVGLFLLVVALVLHIKAVHNLNGKFSDTAFALKVGLIGMLVQGITMDVQYMKSLWLVLAMMVMVSAGEFRQRQGALNSNIVTPEPQRTVLGGFCGSSMQYQVSADTQLKVN